MKVEYENEIIEFNVKYGKGKKLSIEMDSFGFLTLKAPNGTSKEVIVRTIKSNGKWILDKMAENKPKEVSANARKYDPQGIFLYLGKEHFLHELIEIGKKDEEALKRSLKKFYVTSCKKIVEERIKVYQAQLKVKPKTIEIVESRVKWGSCNSHRNLTFNYLLAMAPIEVIDYVILHELCHLLHMNHDRSFWRRVGSIMPDYKEKEAYLEMYGQSMTY